jgi:hypothetical protein
MIDSLRRPRSVPHVHRPCVSTFGLAAAGNYLLAPGSPERTGEVRGSTAKGETNVQSGAVRTVGLDTASKGATAPSSVLGDHRDSQTTTTEPQDRAETITSHLDAIETATDDGPAIKAGVTRQAIEQRLDELVVNRRSVKTLTGTLNSPSLDYTR